ncbi:helix-turn-helix transcriptional regulator [Fibrella forsythiae]|uniref:Helix-turn-helix transcriptional regulator n=1 Tax=Fibrella forsythiae TaxID=2817061 RepID=A0ABS3JJG0_9BACT|nr:AraC family transcriptional regulator [Fibrella forsythiae]MBO0950134.1 helix-turn-helix transcriptional regulator [Fibrella forsythiae]
MEIILRANGVDTCLRQEALKGIDGQPVPFWERQVKVQEAPFGSLVDTQITTGDFFLSHSVFQLNQPIQLLKEVEQEVIQLDFALQGDCLVQPGGKTPRQRFSTGQHNSCYLPQSKSLYTYQAAGLPLDYSAVLIPIDVYRRLVPVEGGSTQPVDALIRQQKAGFGMAKNAPVTSAMDRLIRDIWSSQRTGTLQRLFLEARVLELLMLQLEQMQGVQPVDRTSKQVADRKIQEAREVLDASYVNPPTIIELAKLVGLNEFTLKRGFKEQFGTTILGYITQRRMEDAKRLLLESDETISEVAYWVGYKNPAHFTVAFKQYFGALPSAFRIQGGAGSPALMPINQ